MDAARVARRSAETIRDLYAQELAAETGVGAFALQEWKEGPSMTPAPWPSS